MPPSDSAGTGGVNATAEAMTDAQQPWRKLWLCADDYGISPAVNRGIRDLIDRGRINATSVMVTAPSFSPAEARALVDLASPPHRAAIGLHFALTAPFHPSTLRYRPAATDGAFLGLPRTLLTGLARRLDPAALAAEAAGQFAAFGAAFGRPPDFVDGHQHVHLLPQVSDTLLVAMKEAAPGAWIRQCGRAVPLRQRLRDPKGLLLDILSARLRAHCTVHGVRTNPAFAGTYNFRRQTAYDTLFASFLESLPDGGLVMCHPGLVDEELQRLDDLTIMREQELAFFRGDAFVALMAAAGVALA
jgi:predicted glycoside hydrolase/deacetylase ChbG (UPF0249 family)